MSFDAMWAAPRERRPATPRTGGYRRFAWTREDHDLREWFAGEAAARGLDLTDGPRRQPVGLVGRPRRRGAPATRAWSSARTWTRVPDGGAFDGPLGVVSAPSPRSTCCGPRGSRPPGRSASPASATRRAPGSASPAPGRGCSPARSTADRARGAERRRRRHHGRGDGRGRARPGPARPRPRDAAPDRHVRRAARRAGPGPGRPRPAGRRRRRRSGRTAAGGSTSPGEANHAGTTRLEDRHDPMLGLAAAVLAARAAARGARLRRDRAARCWSSRTASTRSRRGSPRWLDARGAGRRATCARWSPTSARRPGVGAGRGVVDRPTPRSTPRSPRGLAARARRRAAAGHRRRARRGHPRRGRASRPRCCSSATRPGSRTRPAEHAEPDDCLAGVEALARGRAASWPDERRRRATASGSPSTRLLPVGGPARDVPLEVGRRAGSPRSPPAPPAPATPTAARRGAARPRQRAQPRLPPRAARAHARRRRHVLDLARADVRRRRAARPGLLPRAGPRRRTPRWRWPAITVRRASSTTCTTARAACRTTTRTRWARRCAQAAADAGIRLTLLDTCYLAGGLTADGHMPLDERQRRFGDGDVERWAERVHALRPSPGMRGRRGRRTRCAPCRARTHRRRGRAAAEGRPLHVHLSEQPAENDACLGFYGADPDRAARRRGRCSARGPRRSTPPT